MGKELGRAVEDEAALVEDGDAVVELEVAEAVGDGEYRAARAVVGEAVEEMDDFVLGFGIEAAGDLVAEQEDGRLAISMASASRRFWPPESTPVRRSAISSRPASRRISPARCWRVSRSRPPTRRRRAVSMLSATVRRSKEMPNCGT